MINNQHTIFYLLIYNLHFYTTSEDYSAIVYRLNCTLINAAQLLNSFKHASLL